jgi:hypothetical protein
MRTIRGPPPLEDSHCTHHVVNSQACHFILPFTGVSKANTPSLPTLHGPFIVREDREVSPASVVFVSYPYIVDPRAAGLQIIRGMRAIFARGVNHLLADAGLLGKASLDWNQS